MTDRFDKRRRLVDRTPEIAILCSGQCWRNARKVMMSFGFPDQRGVHEVYTTIYNVQGRHLASNDILRVYASDWRSVIDAMYSNAHSA